MESNTAPKCESMAPASYVIWPLPFSASTSSTQMYLREHLSVYILVPGGAQNSVETRSIGTWH